MAKKDFSKANVSNVYEAIAEATAEPEVNEAQEINEGKETNTAYNTQEAPKQKRKRGEHIKQEYSEDEIMMARAQRKTQGKKGVKAVRFCMAFTPEVYDYIVTVSRIRGETVTAFTNHVFEKSMEENKALYNQAKELMAQFK